MNDQHEDCRNKDPYILFERILHQDLCLHQRLRVSGAQQYYENVLALRLAAVPKTSVLYTSLNEMERGLNDFIRGLSIGGKAHEHEETVLSQNR